MPLIRIDRSENFPRPRLARIRKDDSCLYFGPFRTEAPCARHSISFLRYYSLRTCRHPNPGQEEYAHCLSGTVRDCCRPCIGKVSPEEYLARVDSLISLLSGNTDEMTSLLQGKMHEEAQKRNFEKAALYRDISKNIESLYGLGTGHFPMCSSRRWWTGKARWPTFRTRFSFRLLRGP